MTDRPGSPVGSGGRGDADRQADLDWLYGSASKPPPAEPSAPVDQPAGPAPHPGARQRVSPPPHPAEPAPARQPAPRRDPITPAQPRATKPGSSRTTDRRAGAQRPAETSRASAPPAQPRTRRRRRRRLRRLLTIPLLLAAAWAVFLVWVPLHAMGEMATVDESAAIQRPPQQPGTAILLVGSDARPGEEDLDSRADTIMLLYKPANGRSVLVSLPRDSYVNIPGVGAGKLNAAYAYGGVPLLAETVEGATGMRIDGYLQIGLAGFSDLVDAVGGVEVCPEEEIFVDETVIAPGCQVLDGEHALVYVRMRYQDPRGDIGRAERQREVMGKVVGQAASSSTVLNPFRYWNLNMAVSSMLTRGDETGPGDLLGGARALIDISNGNGLSLVVPIADPSGWSADGQSVVIWDSEAALAMFDEMSRGDTSQLDRFLG